MMFDVAYNEAKLFNCLFDTIVKGRKKKKIITTVPRALFHSLTHRLFYLLTLRIVFVFFNMRLF